MKHPWINRHKGTGWIAPANKRDPINLQKRGGIKPEEIKEI